MVETGLHPRPNFHTFLQADSYRSGDALAYYDYQRAIRSKKVEILQQKKSLRYEPGYKKPGVAHSGSRKVFQLKSKHPISATCAVTIDPASFAKTEAPVASTQTEPPAEGANQQLHKSTSLESQSVKQMNKSALLEGENCVGSTSSLDGFEANTASRPSSAKANKENMADTQAAGNSDGRAQTERLPHITATRKPRLVKSARELKFGSSSVSPPPLPQRPKSVATARGGVVEGTEYQGKIGLPVDGRKPLIPNAPKHQRAYSEGLQQVKQENGLPDQEELCRAFRWGTATQRGYDEANWAEKVPIPKSYLPTTTVEQFPDPVTQRLTFRRYNSEPAGWQTFANEWDSIQLRRSDTFIKGPQAVAFCSGSKKTQHIPGYAGYLPGLGVFEEDINIAYTPVNTVRTAKPRKTTISRKANIPGYAGQVHWTAKHAAHSNNPIPEPTTTARIYRPIPLEDEPSPFRRDGIMSKMVTTVSPYNPFNKVEY